MPKNPDEEHLLILDANDAKATAFTLLLNGYTVRAVLSTTTSWTQGRPDAITIDHIELYYRKEDETEEPKT